jgi:5-methylcytosine-specific restriction protein A
MPRAPLGPCSVPACREKQLLGYSRCELHLRQQRSDAYQRRRASAPDEIRFRRSAQWKAASKAQLRREPTCRRCGQPADDVDHVVSLSDGGARLDPGNLQSLCRPCHNRKTAGDRARRRNRGVGVG